MTRKNFIKSHMNYLKLSTECVKNQYEEKNQFLWSHNEPQQQIESFYSTNFFFIVEQKVFNTKRVQGAITTREMTICDAKKY